MKEFVLQLPAGVLVPAFIAFSVTGSLCLKLASQRSGLPAVAVFMAGNVIGFCAATLLTLTLRGRNPNLIYALCLGGGFCTLQLASWLIFRMPLAPAQWMGVGLIAGGMILLQIRL